MLCIVKGVVDEARALLRDLSLTLPVPVAYGGTNLSMCYENGVIVIPTWQIVRTWGPMREGFVRMLLHEHAHAYVRRYYDVLYDAGVEKVFGSFNTPYPDSDFLLMQRFGVANAGYISRYAGSHPEEDFAEVFSWVVWHGGCPPYERQRLLRRKVECVTRVLNRLR